MIMPLKPHPTRQKVIAARARLEAAGDEVTPARLARETGLAWETVKYHVDILRAFGEWPGYRSMHRIVPRD